MKRSPVFTVAVLSSVLALVGCGVSGSNSKHGHIGHDSFYVEAQSNNTLTSDVSGSKSIIYTVDYFGQAPTATLTADANSGFAPGQSTFSKIKSTTLVASDYGQQTKQYTFTFSPQVNTPVNGYATVTFHQAGSTDSKDIAETVHLVNNTGSFTASLGKSTLKSDFSAVVPDSTTLTVNYKGQKEPIVTFPDEFKKDGVTYQKVTNHNNDGTSTDIYTIYFKVNSAIGSGLTTLPAITIHQDVSKTPDNKNFVITLNNTSNTFHPSATSFTLNAAANTTVTKYLAIKYSGSLDNLKVTTPQSKDVLSVAQDKTSEDCNTQGLTAKIFSTAEPVACYKITYKPTKKDNGSAKIDIRQVNSSTTPGADPIVVKINYASGSAKNFYVASYGSSSLKNKSLQKIPTVGLTNPNWVSAFSAGDSMFTPLSKDSSYYSFGANGYVGGYTASSVSQNNGYILSGDDTLISLFDKDNKYYFNSMKIINVLYKGKPALLSFERIYSTAVGYQNTFLISIVASDGKTYHSVIASDGSSKATSSAPVNNHDKKVNGNSTLTFFTDTSSPDTPDTPDTFKIAVSDIAAASSSDKYNVVLASKKGYISFVFDPSVIKPAAPSNMLDSDPLNPLDVRGYAISNIKYTNADKNTDVFANLSMDSLTAQTDGSLKKTQEKYTVELGDSSLTFINPKAIDNGVDTTKVSFADGVTGASLRDYQYIYCNTLVPGAKLPSTCYLLNNNGNVAKLGIDPATSKVTSLSAGTISMTVDQSDNAPRAQIDADTGDMLFVSGGTLKHCNVKSPEKIVAPTSVTAPPGAGTAYAAYQD